ncbi:hypothetical protein IMCC21906_02923 [Spongiibacter sp. IMCC21906]|uniref:hypothetical protein n=1 Tax=Spongiibacter sp. IMCC21906 TaxID=1620392 RepID=UPI00062DCE18|nr:hypothetical protein [Spongiibacter sp. IMCC21906]AKH70563.1 hypothetical protein IMCC21906_02923 [Spongiibacter sp. IMCC21906]
MINKSTRLRFNRRPLPVFPEHRPLYKISQVLLILYLASRGGRSKLPRLHLLNWALKSNERRQQLVVAAKSKNLNVSAWGFDPSLAIAIRFALAEGLLYEDSAAYRISELGEVFLQELLKNEGLLASERSFLFEIGKNITERMVDDASSGWEAE